MPESADGKRTYSERNVRRTDVVIEFKNGRKVPMTISCRADGECVVLPRPTEEIIFPKVVKVEKAKKEVKK